jgi:hypothetical protein
MKLLCTKCDVPNSMFSKGETYECIKKQGTHGHTILDDQGMVRLIYLSPESQMGRYVVKIDKISPQTIVYYAHFQKEG